MSEETKTIQVIIGIIAVLLISQPIAPMIGTVAAGDIHDSEIHVMESDGEYTLTADLNGNNPDDYILDWNVMYPRTETAHLKGEAITLKPEQDGEMYVELRVKDGDYTETIIEKYIQVGNGTDDPYNLLTNRPTQVSDPTNESVVVDIEFSATYDEVLIKLQNSSGTVGTASVSGSDGEIVTEKFSVAEAGNYSVEIWSPSESAAFMDVAVSVVSPAAVGGGVIPDYDSGSAPPIVVILVVLGALVVILR